MPRKRPICIGFEEAAYARLEAASGAPRFRGSIAAVVREAVDLWIRAQDDPRGITEETLWTEVREVSGVLRDLRRKVEVIESTLARSSLNSARTEESSRRSDVIPEPP